MMTNSHAPQGMPLRFRLIRYLAFVPLHPATSVGISPTQLTQHGDVTTSSGMRVLRILLHSCRDSSRVTPGEIRLSGTLPIRRADEPKLESSLGKGRDWQSHPLHVKVDITGSFQIIVKYGCGDPVRKLYPSQSQGSLPIPHMSDPPLAAQLHLDVLFVFMSSDEPSARDRPVCSTADRNMDER